MGTDNKNFKKDLERSICHESPLPKTNSPLGSSSLQKDKDTMLISTLSSISDSIIELDSRLRNVEHALQSTQDALLQIFPDEINKHDLPKKKTEG